MIYTVLVEYGKTGLNKKNKKIIVSKLVEKIPRFSGLPVGTPGKVLELLSEGINSPVSAFSMIKRSCVIDFVHFRSETSNEKTFSMKLRKITEGLNKFQFNCVIDMVPYPVYEMMTAGQIDPKYGPVLFKYYILRVVDVIANCLSSNGIVTRDSLDKINLYTFDNINSVILNIDTQIYTPLLTYDKGKNIKVSRNIKCLYLSVEDYKSCSLVYSKKILTLNNNYNFEDILSDFDMDLLVRESLIQSKAFKINSIMDIENDISNFSRIPMKKRGEN